MNMLPYNHAVVDAWFTKETDHVIHTKDGQTLIAGLFRKRKNYDEDGEYVWITAEGMREVDPSIITHYAVIQF